MSWSWSNFAGGRHLWNHRCCRTFSCALWFISALSQQGGLNSYQTGYVRWLESIRYLSLIMKCCRIWTSLLFSHNICNCLQPPWFKSLPRVIMSSGKKCIWLCSTIFWIMQGSLTAGDNFWCLKSYGRLREGSICHMSLLYARRARQTRTNTETLPKVWDFIIPRRFSWCCVINIHVYRPRPLLLTERKYKLFNLLL